MYRYEPKDNYIIYKDLVEKVKITIPKEDFLDFIEFKEPRKLLTNEYREAMDNPISSEKLEIIAKGSKKVSIIVSDSTRGIPTAKILPFVIEDLLKAGISYDQICIVIALGVHRPATKEEIEEIVGVEYVDKIEIQNHEPYDYNKLVYLGDTSFGTPVEVNKTVYDSDLRIIIGKVEPHEFAGFSGGRKSVLPGISSEKTIEINHRPEMLLHKNARPGVMIGNPINEDMEESARMLGINFAINLVQDSDADIIGVFCGDLFQSHYSAIDFIKSFCDITLHEKADIVVTTPGVPLNIDLYQSIKPIIALAPVMKKDGVIVMYSECTEGVNSEDMVRAYDGATSLENVIQNLTEDYKIQMDHSLLLSKIMQQKIKIVTYSPNVEDEVFEKMFIIPSTSTEDALKKAYEIVGKDHPKVLFFPQPQRTLPVLGLNSFFSALLK